jgi:hypothetical protein
MCVEPECKSLAVWTAEKWVISVGHTKYCVALNQVVRQERNFICPVYKICLSAQLLLKLY